MMADAQHFEGIGLSVHVVLRLRSDRYVELWKPLRNRIESDVEIFQIQYIPVQIAKRS
jgi:hypothetical protein